MNAETLTSLYGYTHYTLTRNSAGISHEESLRSPQPGGNCLNWVLGHIVVHRNYILGLLAEPPVWTKEEADLYDRGSAPLTASSKAHPFPEILAALDRSQERMLARLGGCPKPISPHPSTAGPWARSSPSISFTRPITQGRQGFSGAWPEKREHSAE